VEPYTATAFSTSSKRNVDAVSRRCLTVILRGISGSSTGVHWRFNRLRRYAGGRTLYLILADVLDRLPGILSDLNGSRA
jgi:hypothetical protein